MTEDNMTDVPTEGDTTVIENTETENSEDSSTKSNDTEDTQSPAGDDTNSQDDDTDKDLPFHEHPRWKQRETEWNDRFNDQETRHQQDLQGLREEFAPKKTEDATSTAIPSWFGGDQASWDAYRAERDRELKETEDRAFNRFTQTSETQNKKVQEATDFLKSEVTAIESDKDLNPTGSKIDPNKLLKFTLDNDLVDSQGRWNYRAAFKLMSKEAPAPKPAPKPPTDARKAAAGATNSETRAESKPANYKTSQDFKKSRPW